MRFRLAAIVAALWMPVGTGSALAQFNIKWTYTCASGRFKVSYSKKDSPNRTWHYCFDGKYYTGKTLPDDVRAYFYDMDRRLKESKEKFDQDWAEHKQRQEQADADRRARGLPTSAERLAQARQRHLERTGRAPANGASQGTRHLSPAMSYSRTGGIVEASGKPEAEPITPDALKAIAPGTTAADLVATLGEPPGKVATGEGAESWTYVLTTGAFAKVKMEAGAVKEVVLPN